METESDKLALAVVIIFATLALPTLFVTYRHGFRGLAILGWGYLFIFCSLKIIGSAMQLVDSQSVGASLVNNIGLSPLLLAVAGVLHQSRYYFATASKRSQQRAAQIATTVAYHMFILLGLVLVAIGTLRINNTQGEDDKAWILARVGGAVMLAGWLALVGLAAHSCFTGHMVAHGLGRRKNSAILLMGVIAALPFLGVRVVATFTYLVKKDQGISAVAGSLGVKIYLYLIHEVIVTLILLGAGLLTISIARQPELPADADTTAGYKMVEPLQPGEIGAE